MQKHKVLLVEGDCSLQEGATMKTSDKQGHRFHMLRADSISYAMIALKLQIHS